MGTPNRNAPGKDREGADLLTLARKLEAQSTWLEGNLKSQVLSEAKYLREDWELENLESDSLAIVSGPGM